MSGGTDKPIDQRLLDEAMASAMSKLPPPGARNQAGQAYDGSVAGVLTWLGLTAGYVHDYLLSEPEAVAYFGDDLGLIQFGSTIDTKWWGVVNTVKAAYEALCIDGNLGAMLEMGDLLDGNGNKTHPGAKQAARLPFEIRRDANETELLMQKGDPYIPLLATLEITDPGVTYAKFIDSPAQRWYGFFQGGAKAYPADTGSSGPEVANRLRQTAFDLGIRLNTSGSDVPFEWTVAELEMTNSFAGVTPAEEAEVLAKLLGNAAFAAGDPKQPGTPAHYFTTNQTERKTFDVASEFALHGPLTAMVIEFNVPIDLAEVPLVSGGDYVAWFMWAGYAITRWCQFIKKVTTKDIEVVCRFNSEMNRNFYVFHNIHFARRFREHFKAMVTGMRAGEKSATADGAAAANIRFAVVPHIVTSGGDGLAERPASFQELKSLLPAEAADIDYIGADVYSIPAEDAVAALFDLVDQTLTHYEGDKQEANHIGLLVPEIGRPLYRSFDWSHRVMWWDDLPPTEPGGKPDPSFRTDLKTGILGDSVKAEKQQWSAGGRTHQYRLWDFVRGWWMTAVLTGIRARRLDLITKHPGYLAKTVVLYFMPNKQSIEYSLPSGAPPFNTWPWQADYSYTANWNDTDSADGTAVPATYQPAYQVATAWTDPATPVYPWYDSAWSTYPAWEEWPALTADGARNLLRDCVANTTWEVAKTLLLPALGNAWGEGRLAWLLFADLNQGPNGQVLPGNFDPSAALDPKLVSGKLAYVPYQKAPVK